MSTKKGGKGSVAESTYELHDIVLAKVKGHPAWPARVVDPEKAPQNLQDPKKMAQKSQYLVKFFQTGDFSWLNAKELSKLQKHEIQAFIENPHKKGADLKEAYQIALDPTDWEARQAEAAERAQREAEEDAERIKALEEDELEEPAEGGSNGVGAGKKRKRKNEGKPKESSAAKKRKADGDAKKKVVKKVKEEAPAGGQELVRHWRHRLQKIFLSSKDSTADPSLMPEVDDVLTAIEGFDMQFDWLQETKLGKVLKRIAALAEDQVPSDLEYSIRMRCKQLQTKWADQFNSTSNNPMPAAAGEGIEGGPAKDGEKDGDGDEAMAADAAAIPGLGDEKKPGDGDGSTGTNDGEGEGQEDKAVDRKVEEQKGDEMEVENGEAKLPTPAANGANGSV